MILSNTKKSWLQLWQGPIYFRREISDGSKIIIGSTISEIVMRANKAKKNSCYQYAFDENNGCLYINWILKSVDNKIEKLKEAIPDYNKQFDLMWEKHNPMHISLLLAGKPHNYTTEGLSAITGANQILSEIKVGFLYAVRADACRIYARVGSVCADFSHIPFDVFCQYQVTDWGFEVRSGGKAVLEGEPNLHSIYVEPSSQYVAGASGASGRPTSWHLVEPFLKERLENGVFEKSLTKEAAFLSKWLEANHHNMPAIQPKTMENKIRELYNKQNSKSANNS